MIYIIPLIILFIFTYGAIKKVKLYDSFCSGIKTAFPQVLSIFPYLAAIMIMSEIFEVSGLSGALINLLTPFFRLFGIPKELIKLVLIKPFSGSGSLAILTEIIQTNGVDCYISRLACVVFGSSETTFYISAVYFSSCKNKLPFTPILISLVASFISTVAAVFICNFL